MKKCLLFVSFVIVSVLSFAQDNISVGPVAGFGHTWISNVDGDARYKPSGSLVASCTIAHPNILVLQQD